MKRKNILGLIAAFAIFMGFGMIHSGDVLRENIGGSLIGVGSFYFIVVLFLNLRKDRKRDEH